MTQAVNLHGAQNNVFWCTQKGGSSTNEVYVCQADCCAFRANSSKERLKKSYKRKLDAAKKEVMLSLTPPPPPSFPLSAPSYYVMPLIRPPPLIRKLEEGDEGDCPECDDIPPTKAAPGEWYRKGIEAEAGCKAVLQVQYVSMSQLFRGNYNR